ncbi:hypothetical protein D3C85_1301190 [compost metagenome]
MNTPQSRDTVLTVCLLPVAARWIGNRVRFELNGRAFYPVRRFPLMKAAPIEARASLYRSPAGYGIGHETAATGFWFNFLKVKGAGLQRDQHWLQINTACSTERCHCRAKCSSAWEMPSTGLWCGRARAVGRF